MLSHFVTPPSFWEQLTGQIVSTLLNGADGNLFRRIDCRS